MIITLSDNGFDTMDPIHIETGLGIVIAVCLAIAAALVILVVWLSRPNRKPTKKPIMDVMMRPRARRYGTNASMMWLPVTPRAILRGRTRSLCLQPSQGISHPQPPAAMCAAKRSPTLKRLHARQAISMVSPCSGRPSKRCILRNSLTPNAITPPGRPLSNKLESGLPILWKGGDE